MKWLAEVADKYHNLIVNPKLIAQTIIVVIHNRDTFTFLTRISHQYNGTLLKLKEINENNKRTKLFMRNHPHYLSVSYLKDHPSISRERRNTDFRTREPRNQ